MFEHLAIRSHSIIPNTTGAEYMSTTLLDEPAVRPSTFPAHQRIDMIGFDMEVYAADLFLC
jgi:hypothetical protein